MKQALNGIAPEGQMWVCGACGKYSRNRYTVGDESCYINSVLCYEDSLEKDETGRIIKAKAVKEEE